MSRIVRSNSNHLRGRVCGCAVAPLGELELRALRLPGATPGPGTTHTLVRRAVGGPRGAVSPRVSTRTLTRWPGSALNASVSLRRVATAAATCVVALVVALAVPVSQLRTVTFVHECCCPDPANCHCPKPKAGHDAVPTMRACHESNRAIVAPTLPAFSAPERSLMPPPACADVAVVAELAEPHAAPPPARPDAPS